MTVDNTEKHNSELILILVIILAVATIIGLYYWSGQHIITDIINAQELSQHYSKQARGLYNDKFNMVKHHPF